MAMVADVNRHGAPDPWLLGPAARRQNRRPSYLIRQEALADEHY
jgi:hypothetical protein